MKKFFKKIFVASITAGSFIFIPPLDTLNFVQTVQAELKTYTGVGKCVQGDLITIEQAKNYARLRAEINAKEQAGIYLTDYTRQQNFTLAENKIGVIINSILNFVSDVQYTQKPFDLNGVPAVVYTATLNANIDTDGINAYISRSLKTDEDGNATSQIELQSAIKDIKENLDKIDILIERYNKATSQAEKDKIRAEFNQADRNILAGQKFDEGNEFHTKGEYQKAIELYSEALAFDQNYYWAYYNRGTAYGRDLKQYERAIVDLTRAIEINPNLSAPYNNRGIVYAKLKQYETAISDYNKAIEINPNDEKVYNNRGIIYSRDLKRYDAAIVDFTRAIVLNPNVALAYKNRGITYALSKNYKQAIQDTTKAIELNPNDAKTYRIRGICYQVLGETKKANADFAKAKELDYKS